MLHDEDTNNNIGYHYFRVVGVLQHQVTVLFACFFQL